MARPCLPLLFQFERRPTRLGLALHARAHLVTSAIAPHRNGLRLSMRRYLEVASGSIPLLLIASVARGEARNSINRFEAALSFESATTAAAKTWIN
jgi:hypothetical protein